MKYVAWLLLLLSALAAPSAFAGCSYDGSHTYTCVTNADAMSEIDVVAGEIDPACQYYWGVNYDHYVKGDSTSDPDGSGSVVVAYWCANASDGRATGIGFSATFIWGPSPTCSTSNSNLNATEYSTGSNNDIPSAGSTVCDNTTSPACAFTWNPTDAARWSSVYLRFIQPGQMVAQKTTCTAGAPPPAPPDVTPPPLSPPPPPPPPTPPPQGNPPPPPPECAATNSCPPPPPPPPPPTGTGGSTGADIGALASILGGKLDALLAGQKSLYDEAVSSANQISSVIQAAADQTAKAIQGIPGGSGTDMTATNALLQSIKDNTAHGTVTGGPDCTTAPSVSGGDPTGNDTLLQTWKTACAGQGVVTGGTDCATPPSVTGGDLVRNAALLQDWKARCQVASMLSSTTDDSNIGDPGTGDSAWASTGSDSSSGLDDSGLGYGRTCPSPPSFVVFGNTITLDTSILCSWLALSGALVLIMAGLACIRILASAA